MYIFNGDSYKWRKAVSCDLILWCIFCLRGRLIFLFIYSVASSADDPKRIVEKNHRKQFIKQKDKLNLDLSSTRCGDLALLLICLKLTLFACFLPTSGDNLFKIHLPFWGLDVRTTCLLSRPAFYLSFSRNFWLLYETVIISTNWDSCLSTHINPVVEFYFSLCLHFVVGSVWNTT